MHKDNHDLINFTKDNFQDLPIISIFDSITSICSKKLLKKGISHSTTNPLSAKILQRELISIIKVFFSSSNIIIVHKKITDFIQNLQPLPNTIFQILQICDDEEVPIKELIKVIKTDPIISANILNKANSPLYGNTELKTIDQAVTKFGKRAIKALAMCGMYNSMGKVDLNAYNMNEDNFSNVSMARLSLMLKWYSKVSISALSILSSTALLGNIGQLLISKEITQNDNTEDFHSLSSTCSIKYTEESIMHTTTNIVSSQILNYWKLSKDIVDIISYSDDPIEAPDELRKLCVANYIVYKLIDIKGNIAKKIPDELLPIIAEFNFDIAPLNKALESLVESSS